MKRHTLDNLVLTLMTDLDEDVTLEFTNEPDAGKRIIGEVGLCIDGELTVDWTSPKALKAWMLGAIWASRRAFGSK